MVKKGADKTIDTGAKRGKSAKVEPLRPQETQRAGMSSGLAHDQIAKRAREIWERHGRPHGEEEKNWREAEDELKREMGMSR